MSSSGPPSSPTVLVEAAAAILRAASGALPITSLNKALFYLDLRSLRDTGRVVTDTDYLALKAGPVVASYERRIIGAMERAGIAQQDDDGTAKPMCLVRIPEFTRLDEHQLKAANELGTWAGRWTAKKLSDYSHENIGWQLAWRAGLGGGGPVACPVNMRIAMQQLVDADPWVHEEPATEVLEALREADRTSGAAF